MAAHANTGKYCEENTMKRFIYFLQFSVLIASLFGLSLPAQALPYAYAVNVVHNTVQIIDTATNTLVAIVPVGSFPVSAAVNPAGTRVYVANRNDSTISVI